MGLIKWYKDLMAGVCSPIGSHPDDDPALRYQPGEKVLCIYGHYEGEIVTVREILPGTKNIPGFIYACEASDGEKLTLGPLDVMEVEDDYEPYGDDWVKEMMRFDKTSLISMLREELKITKGGG